MLIAEKTRLSFRLSSWMIWMLSRNRITTRMPMWNFIVQDGEMMVQLHIQQKMVTELTIPTFLNVI